MRSPNLLAAAARAADGEGAKEGKHRGRVDNLNPPRLNLSPPFILSCPLSSSHVSSRAPRSAAFCFVEDDGVKFQLLFLQRPEGGEAGGGGEAEGRWVLPPSLSRCLSYTPLLL